jgi:hypothetical protein
VRQVSASSFDSCTRYSLTSLQHFQSYIQPIKRRFSFKGLICFLSNKEGHMYRRIYA